MPAADTTDVPTRPNGHLTPTLAEPAYHGLVGDFLRAVAPYTEATDARLLAREETARRAAVLMNCLGRNYFSPERWKIPLLNRLKVPDIPTALGWLYVAEGSNLGAAFLIKEAEKLGLSETRMAHAISPATRRARQALAHVHRRARRARAYRRGERALDRRGGSRVPARAGSGRSRFAV